MAALAFDSAPVALAVMTPDGHWAGVNQALCDLLGYPAEQLLGETYQSLTHPDDLGLDEEAVALLLSEGGRGPSIEKRYRHADGHMIWVRVTATLFRDADGVPIGAVAAVEDVAEHRHRHAELSRLALHDPLTGVRNRALLDDDIDRALRTRDRDGGVVAVLYLDVDDFKEINDAHGHETGDLALVVLSARLRDALREEDTVARLGGDEFVLVAHVPTADHAEELRDRVERACAEPLVLAEQTLSVRVSVGMAVIDTSGWASARALADADAAMYARKRGRKEGDTR
ncbi:MAG: domain S-box-containing protein/diguanylate cyclase protein [Modestobacter sp.]|jgi:diguanylate cyclase (GGDEF)-like protein/PAS domain S-box-containing protein|nr:domain S-box-containing protein/diguanylate cyclase protein [Modestobacter sp.]